MLTVGRGRGAGGGVQRIGPALVMPSAARMSLLEHPCDQHFAQARPSIYPTATERFLPWWTGHLIRRLVPVNWAGCVAVLTVTPLVLPVGCYRRAFFGPLLWSIRLEEEMEPVGLRLACLAGTEEGVKLVADTLALGFGVVGVQEGAFSCRAQNPALLNFSFSSRVSALSRVISWPSVSLVGFHTPPISVSTSPSMV